MQAAEWLGLLKLIPPADHGNVTIGTVNRDILAVQNIIRLEPAYAVIRGRFAGTNEVRVFCLPYDQLSFIHFLRAVTDERLAQHLGQPIRPAESQPVAVVEEAQESESEASAARIAQTPVQPEPNGESTAESPPAEHAARKPASSANLATLRELVRRRKADPAGGPAKS